MHYKKTTVVHVIFLCFLLVSIISCGGSSAFKRGINYEKLKNHDAALESYRKALEEDPENSKYLLYYERARFRAAMDHFKKGRRLKEANQLFEALAEFRMAASIDPSIDLASQEIQTIESIIEDQEKKALAEKIESEERSKIESPAEQFLPIIKLSGAVQRAYETLGKLGGINVIFAPDFKPAPSDISLDLKDVTLTEALDLLSLMSKTYWSVVNPKTILVAVDNQQTRQKYQEEMIKTFYVSNVSGQQELTQVATALRSLLLMNKVAQIDSQNALVVRDTPDKIAAAEEILKSLDKSRPEVIIEVLIVEVSRALRKTLGINPGLPNRIDFSQSTDIPNPNATNNSSGSNTISIKDMGNIASGNFFITIPTSLLGHLYNRADGKVLQNPSLRATDGKPAKLRIGTQQPIAQGSFSTGIGGQVGFGGGGFTTFTTVDVGVTLDLTPRVLLNRDVSLNIKVALKTITGFENLGGNRYPILANREIEHDIQLKEGESSVVGGIIQESDTVSVEGTNGLSKIPLLKYLFSTEDTSITKNEVLIIITPTIVRIPNPLEKHPSLALLGSNNTPRFLGEKSPLLGKSEVKVQKTRPVSSQNDTLPSDQSPIELEDSSSKIHSQVAPRLAFVEMDSSVTNVALKTPFGITIPVKNGQNIHGLSFVVKFDHNILELVEVKDAGFLSSDGQAVALAERLDNELGHAIISMTRPPSSAGISGAGMLMHLVFRPIKLGDTFVKFDKSSILRDSQNTTIPTSFSATHITVK